MLHQADAWVVSGDADNLTITVFLQETALACGQIVADGLNFVLILSCSRRGAAVSTTVTTFVHR